MSQHSSEAIHRTKRQVAAYERLSEGTFSGSGSISGDSTGALIGLQDEDFTAERDHLHFRPNSSQAKSRNSSGRHRTHHGHSAAIENLLTQDPKLGWPGIVQDPQNGMQGSLSQGMPMTQDIMINHYPNSRLESYNPGDDHPYVLGDESLDLNFADLSKYISLDPTDTNMIHSPTLLAPSPVGCTARGPSATTIANGSSVHAQDTFDADFEAWSYFRCNPSSGKRIHPKTARIFLEGLEKILRGHYTAQPLNLLLSEDNERLVSNGIISVEPFSSRVRNKLMVITQAILHKARTIHDSSARKTLEYLQHHLVDSTASFGCFSIFPSIDDMGRLLQSYANRYEPYYASIPSGLLSPTSILDSTDERCSSLLLLLMLAQGSMATSTREARNLTSGLTELCRLSWFDLVEKDVCLSSEPTMLRSAFMIMNLAAWSGEKWHMHVSTQFLRRGSI